MRLMELVMAISAKPFLSMLNASEKVIYDIIVKLIFSIKLAYLKIKENTMNEYLKIFEDTGNDFLQGLGIGQNIEQLNTLIIKIAGLEQENRRLKKVITETVEILKTA